MIINSKASIKFFSLLGMVFIILILLLEKLSMFEIPVLTTIILLTILISLMVTILKSS